MEFILANCRIFAMVCVALFVAQAFSNYTFDIKHAFIAFGIIAVSIIIYSLIMVICDAIFSNQK